MGNFKRTNSAWQGIWMASMVLAPSLILIAQFYWNNGVLNGTSGAIQIYGFFFWMLAFIGIYGIVSDKKPGLGATGIVVAVFACIGGSNFGLDGIYSQAAGITDEVAKNAFHARMQPEIILGMYIPGIFFPLSLIMAGFSLFATKNIPLWCFLFLTVSAVGFPMSRIPRLEWLAHADNFLMLTSNIAVLMYATRAVKSNLNSPYPA